MKNLKYLVYLICLSPILIILYFWWNNSGSQLSGPVGLSVIAVGRLCGLLGTFFILIQFLLRARIQPIENIVGFMEIDRIHKKNGYVAISFLVIHPILLTIGYAITGQKGLIDQFITFLLQYDDVLNAFLGLSLFLVVIGTSIYMVRRKLPYHWWYFIHLATYIAILLAFGHQLTNGEDFIANPVFVYFWYLLYALVFGATLYWKIIRVAAMYFKHRFYVAEVVRESYDTVSLYIKGRNMQDIHYVAGQFSFLHLLSKELWWDVHPFSISCAPNGHYIRFTIKASGDYTKKVPNVPIGTPVVLDMPHGEFTLNQSHSKKLLFIAGGVGLTPLRAMLEAAGNGYDSVLIFANKTAADILLKSELENISKDNDVPIYYVMSNDPTYPGLKGFVSIDLLKQNVPDFMDRDVFLCGPPVMMKLVTAALIKEGMSDEKIHSEEFSL